MVHRQPRNGAPQRLAPHGGPHTQLIPIGVGVLAPLRCPTREVRGGLGSSGGERPKLILEPVLQPRHQRHHIVGGVVLEELLLLDEDRLAVVRDHHRQPRDVGRPEGPRHRQGHGPGQRIQAPLHLHIAGPGRIAEDARLPPDAPVRATRRLEDLRQVDPQRRISAHGAVPLEHGGRQGRLRQGLLQDVPVDPLTLAAEKRELAGHVGVDLVLVAHVLHYLIPEHREGDGEAPIAYHRIVEQNLLRKALRNLGHHVSAAELHKLPLALVKRHQDTQDAAPQAEPELGVCAVHQESDAHEHAPLDDVLVEHGAEGEARDAGQRLEAKSRDLQVVEGCVQGHDALVADVCLHTKDAQPKQPPHELGAQVDGRQFPRVLLEGAGKFQNDDGAERADQEVHEIEEVWGEMRTDLLEIV
mmetsp:Transcript_8890/g.26973  ORF Transcript_8890/g.26973 Transcript_8890/m.26973 type:complete len:414 (-) Transcript_8890:438-1679(-)